MSDNMTSKTVHTKPATVKDQPLGEKLATIAGIAFTVGVIGYVMFAPHDTPTQNTPTSGIILQP